MDVFQIGFFDAAAPLLTEELARNAARGGPVKGLHRAPCAQKVVDRCSLYRGPAPELERPDLGLGVDAIGQALLVAIPKGNLADIGFDGEGCPDRGDPCECRPESLSIHHCRRGSNRPPARFWLSNSWRTALEIARPSSLP